MLSYLRRKPEHCYNEVVKEIKYTFLFKQEELEELGVKWRPLLTIADLKLIRAGFDDNE